MVRTGSLVKKSSTIALTRTAGLAGSVVVLALIVALLVEGFTGGFCW